MFTCDRCVELQVAANIYPELDVSRLQPCDILITPDIHPGGMRVRGSQGL